MEKAIAAETVGMFGIVALAFGGEEGEVPVFGDIPVEGVEGVEKDKKQPVCVSISVLASMFGLTIVETSQPRSCQSS